MTIANNLVHLYPGTPHGLNEAIWVNGGTGPVLSNSVTAPNSNWFGSVTPPSVRRVNEAGNFLHIRDASIGQIINKGTTNVANLPSPFTDFDGHRRPQGVAVDIGAGEYRVPTPATGLRIVHTNGVVRTTWQVQAGDNYQLQKSTDLSSANWSANGNSVTAGNASLEVFDASPAAARAFYRLVTLP